MVKAIETHECSCAEDLLNVLSPRHEMWKGDIRRWIFRGQSKDRPLFPKIYRQCGLSEFRSEFVAPGQQVPDSTFLELMDQFRDAINRIGLSIPGPDSRFFLHEHAKPTAFPGNAFLSRDAMPLVALAQHLGLPTPLLDWSTRSYVAAYFMLPDTSDGNEEPVVWALNSREMKSQPVAGYELSLIADTPRASNSNLHAQSGLFTVLGGDRAFKTALDDYACIVGEAVIKAPGKTLDQPLMRKFTMSKGGLKSLRQHLVQEGIDAASLFPGYDGVVKYLKNTPY